MPAPSRASVVVRGPDNVERVIELVGSLTVGRAPDGDLVLEDQNVSRRHAVLQRGIDDVFTVSDLGSANGTRVNGRPLEMPRRLRHGDIVSVGSATLTFQEHPSPGLPEDPPTASGGLVANKQSTRIVLGTSQKMAEVFHLVEAAAESPIPVLLQGETGTGKELIARGIHGNGPRYEGPFVAVNCAALNEALLESELFGHRRGAFTGAIADHKGLFEAASGGTIFLDEVGEMAPSLQAKLLRVLEESEIMPVGETRARKVDVRVISATNRDLNDECESGRFRSDLFFRLATFPIHLPPLRERREDIPILARSALGVAAMRHGKRVAGFTPEVLDALSRFHWPGNVRELRNEIQRAVALVRDGSSIELRHLSQKITAMAVPSGSTRPSPEVAARAISMEIPQPPLPVTGETPHAPDRLAPKGLREARIAFEARYIAEVYEQCGRRVGATAELLGLSRVALSKKLKDYKLR